MRPGVALIYLAIAVISASVAAVAHRLTGMPLEFAALFGAILFFALSTFDQAASRVADRKEFEQKLELSDHAVQDAFNEIDMIRSRLVSLETDTQQAVDAGVAPVQQDLQAVGALLAQVTEAVSDTDHRITTLEADLELITNARAAAAGEQSEVAPRAKVANADTDPEESPKSSKAEDDRTNALMKRVKSAVENERFEVALQSIVTLPQRRARGYAVLMNLLLDGVGKLEARHAVPAVEAAGLSATYDRAMVARCLTLARKFKARDSASIVFMPLSGDALMQTSFADWLVQTLTSNQDMVGQLVLELPQKDVRALSPIDFDLLTTIADLGFRMSVSKLVDARSDMFELSRYGFRYAKAPAALFLAGDADVQSDIHPEDLADLAARNGMDLIVDEVESETQVVELLDCNLKYGQGNLFARPRVVEVEPEEAETPDTAAKEPARNKASARGTGSGARALSKTA